MAGADRAVVRAARGSARPPPGGAERGDGGHGEPVLPVELVGARENRRSRSGQDVSSSRGGVPVTPTAPARRPTLLFLLSLLQARRDRPGVLLAERADVSSRTVRRDVERLREPGHPVAGPAEARWSSVRPPRHRRTGEHRARGPSPPPFSTARSPDEPPEADIFRPGSAVPCVGLVRVLNQSPGQTGCLYVPDKIIGRSAGWRRVMNAYGGQSLRPHR